MSQKSGCNVALVSYSASAVVRTAGGSATGDATAWVETPQDMPLASPSLEIVVGPSVERSRWVASIVSAWTIFTPAAVVATPQPSASPFASSPTASCIPRWIR